MTPATFNGSSVHDLARRQQDDFVEKRHDQLARLMNGHEHGALIVHCHILDGLDNVGSGEGVQARRRFVEEEQERIGDQFHGWTKA